MRPLGQLEEQVMDVVWREPEPLAVREVARRLGRRLAYTTVMTTLDRLYKKGLLARTKDGNAYVYRASASRDEYHRRVVESAVSPLLARSAGPVLAGFVDAALTVDRENLARLEAILAARKRGGRR